MLNHTKTIMLLVTYRCNLKCSYCYEPKRVLSRMTLEQAKSCIVRQVNGMGPEYDSFEIQLMGGEPLLVFPLLKELSEWLWRQDFKQSLKTIFAPTNGTLLTDEMKPWLVRHRDRFCLGLSFDGDNLMQSTNRSGSFHRVDLQFYASTWPEQSVKMTVSPATVSSLSDGVVFLHRQGFRHLVADLAMGKNVYWEKSHLDEYKRQLRRLTDYYLANPDMPRVSLLSLPIENVLEGERHPKSCSCGEDFICVDVDGTVYACHLFSPIASNEVTASKSLAFDFSRHVLFESDRCRLCALQVVCNRCCGMSYLVNGNLYEPVAFHCSAFQLQFYANCRLQFLLACQTKDEKRMAFVSKLVSRLS